MQPMGGGGGDVPPYTPGMKTQTLGLDYNIAALVSYFFWPIAVLLIVTEPQEPQRRWVRFHAWQATIFAVSSLVLLNVISVVLSQISTVLAMVGSLLWLGYFVVIVMNMLKAHKGEHMNLGPITKFAASKA